MRATALLLALLLPLRAAAEGLVYVPKWTMVNGKACYEFSDALKLAMIDADLIMLHKQEDIWRTLVTDQKEGSRQVYLALEAQKAATETLRDSDARLAKLLLAETKRANDAEAKQGFQMPWVIAGGVGIAVGVIAGILLGVYATKP